MVIQDYTSGRPTYSEYLPADFRDAIETVDYEADKVFNCSLNENSPQRSCFDGSGSISRNSYSTVSQIYLLGQPLAYADVCVALLLPCLSKRRKLNR